MNTKSMWNKSPCGTKVPVEQKVHLKKKEKMAEQARHREVALPLLPLGPGGVHAFSCTPPGQAQLTTLALSNEQVQGLNLDKYGANSCGCW